MKTRLTAALALVAALAVLALGGCNSEQKRQIGVVDAEVVFQQSNLASAGMRHLEDLTNDMQDRLGKMQEQLVASLEDKALEQKLQTELFALQGNMDRAQRAVAERVNKRFDDAVEECRKSQGLEVVLPKQLVMASGPAADITEQVVAAMDKDALDFSDISLDGPQTAPAGSGEDSGAAPAPAAAGGADAAAPAPPAE